MTYFDNAATSFPKPPQVLDAVRECFEFYGANPGRSGHDMSVATARKVYETRERMAELFGAQTPEDVVFTQNCTHAINICLKGLLRPNDHVIISDLEHNAVARPVAHLAQTMGVQYSILHIHENDEQTLAELKKLIGPRTKLIAVTHCSNVFGIVTPIALMAQMAQEYSIPIMVDAAQSAGVLPIDVTEMGIDFLCMPGHKGLYGPSGTGALITGHGDGLRTLMEGGTGSNSLSLEQPDFLPDKHESGTVNTMGIVGLGAGVQVVAQRGVAEIYRHELELTKMLYEGLDAIRTVNLYTPYPIAGRQAPVLAFTVAGQSGEETCTALNEYGFALRGGYHCAPLAHEKMGTLESGAARASLGMYNTADEVHCFLSAVSEIAGR